MWERRNNENNKKQLTFLQVKQCKAIPVNDSGLFAFTKKQHTQKRREYLPPVYDYGPWYASDIVMKV